MDGTLKADLGNLRRGSTVVVTLDKQANVLLMDLSNYRTYASGGGQFRYYGGLVKRSPARIPVPSSGHWYLAIDLAGRAGQIRHSIAIQPPPRGKLPAYKEPNGSLADRVVVRQPEPPTSGEELHGRTWDVFLSHASEDKSAVALPLTQALPDRRLTVWLDKAELKSGTACADASTAAFEVDSRAVGALSPALGLRRPVRSGCVVDRREGHR